MSFLLLGYHKRERSKTKLFYIIIITRVKFVWYCFCCIVKLACIFLMCLSHMFNLYSPFMLVNKFYKEKRNPNNMLYNEEPTLFLRIILMVESLCYENKSCPTYSPCAKISNISCRLLVLCKQELYFINYTCVMKTRVVLYKLLVLWELYLIDYLCY